MEVGMVQNLAVPSSRHHLFFWQDIHDSKDTVDFPCESGCFSKTIQLQYVVSVLFFKVRGLLIIVFPMTEKIMGADYEYKSSPLDSANNY